MCEGCGLPFPASFSQSQPEKCINENLSIWPLTRLGAEKNGLFVEASYWE